MEGRKRGKKAKFLFAFRTLKGLSAIQSRAPFIQKYLVHEYKHIFQSEPEMCNLVFSSFFRSSLC